MKKKGFTLVELLAVIVILSLLALLTSTAITKLVNDAKKDLSDTQKELIKSAAETWAADNLMKLPDAGQCSYLTLKDLKEYGLMDSTIIDPETNQEISDDLKIKISTTLTTYGNPVRNVEVNPESIDGCSKIYSPICTLASGTALTKGAKYSCQVNDTTNYNFYVLTTPTNESTTVNLIMDRNICEDGTVATETNTCLYAWISKSDYLAAGGTETDWGSDGNNNKGPITAMTKLAEATSTWTNLKEIQVSTFTDDAATAHEMVKTFTTYARLPYKSEVGTSDGTNEYLYENLDGSGWDGSGIQPVNNISGINGYWTLSSTSYGSSGAEIVYYVGVVTSDIASHNSDGVRPVITVPVGRIQ